MSPAAAHRGATPPPGDPAFAAVKAQVIARTGHHYYEDKDDQLWERLAARMDACDIARPAEYLALLDDPVAGPREWRLLESAVTINETFFFRFAEQFAALRQTILPQLIAACGGERRLRIWSVGCATGAEPYSIAILLRELLGEALPGWRVTIIGTDIDEAALATARAGLFGGWALRTLGEAERAALFEREGAQYRLRPRYRGMVRFERHNLMELIDGDTALQFTHFDLILCRNLLIYFRSDVATAAVGALVQRLAGDGVLLVGHAEASPAFAAVARAGEVDGVLVFRRPDAAHEPALAEGGEEPPAAIPLPRRRGAAKPRPRSGPAPAPPALDRPAAAERPADGAAAVSMRDPVPHYLAALSAVALGEAAAAEKGFRSALYLDSGFAMAHYLLGRHLLALGRDDEGRRALVNAARSVAALPAETALREGDGMTAGQLTLAVRHAIGPAA